MEETYQKFHLIGIKGTGMSALAAILQDLGYDVTGSDTEKEYFTERRLEERNISIYVFNQENIKSDVYYIASSAYDDTNVEILRVKEMGYPIMYYHHFIANFFKGNKIGVAGTHGKTTTTLMIANFFKDLKTAYLVGDGEGKADKDYEWFIFEACEYKNHFLNYQYDTLVINNIDLDHVDFFFSIDETIESFQKAASKAKRLVINNDDINCRRINHSDKITYGIDNDANIQATIIQKNINGYSLEVNICGEIKRYYLPFPGKHMIYNFLSALAVCYINNISLDFIQIRLVKMGFPSRRMEEYHYYDNVIIDDYAHHPTEIVACLEAIRQKYGKKKLVVVFQPHTYTRTILLADRFANLFDNVDEFYLKKTFASARETEDKKLDNKIQAIFNHPKAFTKKNIQKFRNYRNSIILFLGAGNFIEDITTLLK